MTKDGLKALRAARNQAQYLKKLRQTAKKDSDAGGGGLHSARIRREGKRMELLEKAAVEEMDGLTPEVYAFCMAYYVGGLTLLEAAEMIDRSERQCNRYKALVERGEEQITEQ